MALLNVILFLTNFVKTLFVIFIIYVVFRFIGRFVLPLLIKKGVESMTQKMQEQYRSQQRYSKREGEVTIEGNRPNGKKNQANEGEYVDFEEVE